MQIFQFPLDIRELKFEHEQCLWIKFTKETIFLKKGLKNVIEQNVKAIERWSGNGKLLWEQMKKGKLQHNVKTKVYMKKKIIKKLCHLPLFNLSVELRDPVYVGLISLPISSIIANNCAYLLRPEADDELDKLAVDVNGVVIFDEICVVLKTGGDPANGGYFSWDAVAAAFDSELDKAAAALAVLVCCCNKANCACSCWVYCKAAAIADADTAALLLLLLELEAAELE